MFFVIPEMPSKTFVMVVKKLPDHFKIGRRHKNKESKEKANIFGWKNNY